MHSRRLQGHGCSHFNSDSGMNPFRYDKPARSQSLRQQHCQRFRTGIPGLPSHDCLPDCCVLSICNRYKLGNLRYSYPHRAGRIPFRTDDGHFHCLLPCRCRLRRPLLSHFRHHHHGFRRRSLQPHQPCCNPASLCVVCCGILFHRLCHHGHLQPRRCTFHRLDCPACMYRADGRYTPVHP